MPTFRCGEAPKNLRVVISARLASAIIFDVPVGGENDPDRLSEDAAQVTVLLPINDAHPGYLSEALASVFDQTSPRWRLLVVVEPHDADKYTQRSCPTGSTTVEFV